MGALSDCIGKMGKLLSPADAKLLMDHAQRLQGEGHDAMSAERMAVEHHASETRAMIDSVYEQAGVKRGSGLAKKAADTQAAHEARLAEMEKAAHEANAPVENPPEVSSEEALPVPPGKTVRDMVRASARIRAIDRELMSAKGQARIPLLEEKLQLGAEMGHERSARELQKWNARDESQDPNAIIRGVVQKYGLSTSKTGTLAGELKALREGKLGVKLRKTGAGMADLEEGIKEALNAAGITHYDPNAPETTGVMGKDVSTAITDAFSAKNMTEPPSFNVPEVKLDRAQKTMAAAQRLADKIRSAKLMPPGAQGAHSPLSWAWDSAVETAALAVEAGGKAAEVIQRAVEHFKEKYPGATDAHVERLKNVIGALTKGWDEAKGAAEPAKVATAEPPAGEPSAFGIKNASVDALSRAQGLGERPAREGTTTTEMHDRANAMLDSDENSGRRLVDELATNPRQIDGPESILVTHEITRNRNARKAASAALDKAIESGDQAAIAQAQGEVDSLRTEFNKLADVSEATGTKWSDVGRARQLALAEDFSPENLERQWVQTEKAAGKTVTPEALKKAREEFKKVAADYERTLEVKDKALAAAQQARAEAEADLAINKLTQKVAWEKKGPPAAPRQGILQSLIDRKAAAEKRILERARSGKTGANRIFDPEEIKDHAEWVAGTIAEGITKGAELSQRLIEKFGESIKPHIPEIIKQGVAIHAKEYFAEAAKAAKPGSRDTPRERKSTVGAMKERAADNDKVSDLGHYVQKIAEQHIRNGVKGRDAVLDATHATVKEAFPDATRTETMHALSGYGKDSKLSKDPVKVELRDIKGQLQQVSKLQDLDRTPPTLRKTGPERRIPSDEERRLIQQVNEAKKKSGYVSTDPATQLKSSLDSIKTRLKNQIKDLDFQISTGKKIVRDKTASPSDPETTALTAQRDALKKQYDDIFSKPDLTDAQKMARASKHLDAEINRLSYQLRTGELFDKGAPRKLTSPELEAKRARIAALKEEREYARHVIQPQADPLTASEKKAADLDRQIKAVENQIKGGAIFDPAKKAPVESTPEIEARKQRLAELKAEREGLRESIQPRDYSAEKLQAYKASLANRYADNLERLAKMQGGDFSKPPARIPTALDKAAETATTENERVKKKIAEMQRAHDKAVRPGWVKGLDFAARFVRGGVLTWPTTIAKLAATTVQQGLIHPMDEMAGSIYKKALPGIFDKAKIEGGGFSVQHQAKAIARGMIDGWKDLKDTLDKSKGNMSELEARYGKGGADRDVLELGSIFHGAEKAPLKRFAFTYAMEKQIAWGLQHGLTEAEMKEPLMQMRMGAEAYKYASRMLFQEDNVVSNGFNRALGALREKDKETGRQSAVRMTGETLARVLLPVAKIGTNIVNQTFARALGLPMAAVETVNAYRRGIENLKPEEADAIARHLKKGAVGLALGTLAFSNPQIFGGFYRKGEKRDPRDLKPGEVKSPVPLPHAVSSSGNIPSYLNHGAASEVLHFYATLRRAMDAKAKKTDTEPQGLGTGAMLATAGLLGESPYVKRAEDLVGALEPKNAGTLAGSVARSAIPGIVQWGAGKMDANELGETTQRKPQGFVDSVKMGIPGLRQDVAKSSYVDPRITKQLGETGLELPAITRPRIGPPNKKVGVDDSTFLQFQKDVGAKLNERLRAEMPNLSTMPHDRAEARIKQIAEDVHTRARIQLELRGKHPIAIPH